MRGKRKSCGDGGEGGRKGEKVPRNKGDGRKVEEGGERRRE